MMRYRLSQLGQDSAVKVLKGTALGIPFADNSFDCVYSIGALHHTGNIVKAISEVHRVLKVGGKAIVMLYNRYSFRQLIFVPILRLKTLLKWKKKDFEERVRALYDVNIKGKVAPHTDFITRSECQRFFKNFTNLKIDVHNFDDLTIIGRTIISRDKLLNNIGRVLGLDLYVTAIK